MSQSIHWQRWPAAESSEAEGAEDFAEMFSGEEESVTSSSAAGEAERALGDWGGWAMGGRAGKGLGASASKSSRKSNG